MSLYVDVQGCMTPWLSKRLASLRLQIIGVDGNEVTLKAINYFGFNTGVSMFDGLYAGSTSISQDFGVILYRIQVLFTPPHLYPERLVVNVRAAVY